MLYKFPYYLSGQPNLTLVTDHKPISGLFSPTKSISVQSSGRIQRWALFLQSYNFTLKHRSGALLGTADALNRLPLLSYTDATPFPMEWSKLVHFMDSTPVTSRGIKMHSSTDPIISKVVKLC